MIFPLKSKRESGAGFTLIEVLVVISIISIISTIAAVNISSAKSKARDARRLQDVKSFVTILQKYYLEHDEWPYFDPLETTVAGNYCAGSQANSLICTSGPIAGGVLFECNSRKPCFCLIGNQPNTLGWLTPLDGGHYPVNDYFASGHATRDPWQEQGCRSGGGDNHPNFNYSYKAKYNTLTGGISISFKYVLEEPYQGALGEEWSNCGSGYCPYGLYGDENGNLESLYVENP